MSMEQALRWITELHPSYPEAIRGCSEDDIALLERTNGHPVPPIHHEFLALMGQEAALPSLFAAGHRADDVDLSFKAVLKASRKMKWQLPARFTRIGVHTDDPYSDFFLDGEPDAVKPRVVRFCLLSSDPKSIDDALTGDMSEAARSLEDLLFAGAVASHCFPRYRASVELYGGQGDEDGLRKADRVFEKLGFARHPALRTTSRYFTRKDAAALVQLAIARRWMFIELHAHSVAEARRLVPHFQELGLWKDEPKEKS